MKRKRVLGGLIAAALIALNYAPSVQSLRNIPELIHLRQGQEKSYSFFLPIKMEVETKNQCVLSSTDETLGARTGTLSSESPGRSQVRFSLLGFIPLKTVTVQVDNEHVLIPGGQSIGLTLFTDGVFIVDGAEVYLPDGSSVNPAKDAGLAAGDCIKSLNGQIVDSMDKLVQIVQESQRETLSVRYIRDGEEYTTEIQPVIDETGEKRLGIWVRDSTAGIGTLTYYDPQTASYGALGHGITDMDTAQLMSLSSVSIMETTVKAVKKGERASPGELKGDFDLTRDSGTLYANTECGIFGKLSAEDAAKITGAALPIAKKDEVKTGKATILATVSGNETREYDIEIEKIYSPSGSTRNLLLRVTDEELLAQTGGVVQGMSGSAILQDGKIIGAVTHVLLDDPSRGYGIFIENMLSAAGLSSE
mgnify:CR=1 FL=1